MLNAIVVSIRFIVLILSVRNSSPWRMPPCAALGRVQTQRSAAKTEQLRSIIFFIGVFVTALTRLGSGRGMRKR
jgi:hypothetical protein